jgi:hypothetical protein
VGIALWMLCGVSAFAAARAIDAGRPPRMIGELLVAMVVALAAGLVATGLDFGGWAELDWRAAAFVVCCTFAAIALSRMIGLLVRRAEQP